MTVAGGIEDHQARCQPYLAVLRTLAGREAGTGLPRQAAAQVARATGAVLAEVEAAVREARSAAACGPGATTLLLVRLRRLSAAAGDALGAASAGDATGMRRQLHRFEALASAIWTVQQSVCGPSVPRSAVVRPGRARPG